MWPYLVALMLLAAPGLSDTAPTSQVAETQPSLAEARQFTKAVVIPIRDVISDVTMESLDRRVSEAVADGVDLIVFEIDTPGGLVSSAIDICDHIKDLTEVYTVAWVKPMAISAGAMISVACNEIVVSGRSKIGDCQPIMIGTGGAEAVPEGVRAKVTSPLLEEFRDSARRNGYDIRLCESMILPDMEIFWVEARSTGEQRFVTRAERDRLFGIAPTQAQVKVGKSVLPKEVTDAIKAVLSLDQTRPDAAPIDETSKTEWQYVEAHPLLGTVTQPIVSSEELLTISQDQAIAYGFAKHKLPTLPAIMDHFGLAEPPERLGYNWSETLVEWLTSPLVRGALMVVLMLSAYVEFHTPGVGLAGLVALICLVIFLGAPYLTGLADFWDVLAVVAGVILIALELFVIPGFGVAGILGAILIGLGLVTSFVGPEAPNQPPFHLPTMDYTISAMQTGLWVLVASLGSALAGALVLRRYLSEMPYFGQMITPNPTPETVAMPDPYPETVVNPGAVGVAESMLRPAGKARFGDALIDVVTEGEFIEHGHNVQVVEYRGNRVVVRHVRD